MSLQTVQPRHLLHNTLIASGNGAMTGITAATLIVPVALMFNFFEVMHRAAGGEPKWPMNLGEECKLPQFKDLSWCRDPEESQIYFTTVVCGLVIGGAAVGALWGLVHGLKNPQNRQ